MWEIMQFFYGLLMEMLDTLHTVALVTCPLFVLSSLRRSTRDTLALLVVGMLVATIIRFEPVVTPDTLDAIAARAAANAPVEGSSTPNPRLAQPEPEAAPAPSSQADGNIPVAVMPMSGKELIEQEQKALFDFSLGGSTRHHIPTQSMNRMVDQVHRDFEKFNKKRDPFMSKCGETQHLM